MHRVFSPLAAFGNLALGRQNSSDAVTQSSTLTDRGVASLSGEHLGACACQESDPSERAADQVLWGAGNPQESAGSGLVPMTRCAVIGMSAVYMVLFGGSECSSALMGFLSGYAPARPSLPPPRPLQPQLARAVLAEQAAVPDIPPHHLNGPMARLVHDGPLRRAGDGCGSGVPAPVGVPETAFFSLRASRSRLGPALPLLRGGAGAGTGVFP